jgi:NADPH:quinone reductase-like Zn-dependent oxidoreductase
MKAIICEGYGPPEVLQVREVEKPSPKAGEVLIKVHAATVTTGDVNVRGFTFVPPGFGSLPRLMFGWKKPRIPILGTELAGVVEAVGSAVTQFKPGDPVFGIGSSHFGAYAEYTCRPASGALALKPGNLSFEEAAALPFGGGTALFFLRDKARIQPGQKVLVVGASGGVGAYAVQLAKFYGTEVTGVCSTANLELVESLGAGRIIDYTREDPAQSGETFDIIFDTVAGKTSFSRYKRSLKPGGRYLAVAGGLKELFQMIATSVTGGRKVVFGSPVENAEDLVFLGELAAKGIIKPFIDKRFPLEQAAEAHRFVDTGRKRGNVVLTLAGFEFGTP